MNKKHQTKTDSSAALAALRQSREEASRLCVAASGILTHIHISIPPVIPGLAIERLRLLCADTLKERLATVGNSFRNGLSDAFAAAVGPEERRRINDALGILALVLDEARRLDQALTPVFKAWSPNSPVAFDGYAERLAGLSARLDEADGLVQSFVQSVAERLADGGEGHAVPERLRRLLPETADPDVRSALEQLAELARRHYEALDCQVKARVEHYYFPTLELLLAECRHIRQEEAAGLCLRAIAVLRGVIESGSQARREWRTLDLAAEVAAMERLAVLRGDVPDGSPMGPDGV